MANPYFPNWEYIPDGEPRVFGDRVYVYGWLMPSADLVGGGLGCLWTGEGLTVTIMTINFPIDTTYIYTARQQNQTGFYWRAAFFIFLLYHLYW